MRRPDEKVYFGMHQDGLPFIGTEDQIKLNLNDEQPVWEVPEEELPFILLDPMVMAPPVQIDALEDFVERPSFRERDLLLSKGRLRLQQRELRSIAETSTDEAERLAAAEIVDEHEQEIARLDAETAQLKARVRQHRDRAVTCWRGGLNTRRDMALGREA